MKEIVIFGYGINGAKLYLQLQESLEYKVIGLADNNVYKKGLLVDGHIVLDIEDLKNLFKTKKFSCIVSVVNKNGYIIEQLQTAGIPVEGIYKQGHIIPYENLDIRRLDFSKNINLYAGDIPNKRLSEPDLYGLSITKVDDKHFFHDITNKYPLPDNCIHSYWAEDVLEHINLEQIVPTINEIYRILRPGCLFRISLPDYNSPRLKKVAMYSTEGELLFDPTGGGDFGKEGVTNGGHVWFPTYDIIKGVLEKTNFSKIEYLCYYAKEGQLIKKEIDFSKGCLNRVNESDENVYSIVIDCYK